MHWVPRWYNFAARGKIFFRLVNRLIAGPDRTVAKPTDHVSYIIDNDIVDVIIGKILWDPEDFDGQTYDNAMRVFTLDIHMSNYFMTIKNPMAYQLAIKYIGIGISLQQTALALQATK